MSDCIFCKIGRKEIPGKMVYEDDELFAFEDIAPKAPTHILICPRKHVASLSEASANDAGWLGRAQLVAAKLANERRLSGFRTVINNGAEAGQSVFHMHVHLMGGREFRWPPG
jgi:histidine triad (HIT) family protein